MRDKEILSGNSEAGEQNQWIEAMSDMPEYEPAHTLDHEEESPESGEIVEERSAYDVSQEELNSPEFRDNRNRANFNNTTRRLAYIASKFPKIQEAPQDIQDEYLTLELKRSRLVGENSGMHVQGAALARDGAIVSKWKLAEYNADADKLKDLHWKNHENFDYSEEFEFSLPEIDIAPLEEKVKTINDDYRNYQKIDNEISEAQRFADMDTYNKLRMLRNEAIDNWAKQSRLKESQS